MVRLQMKTVSQTARQVKVKREMVRLVKTERQKASRILKKARQRKISQIHKIVKLSTRMIQPSLMLQSSVRRSQILWKLSRVNHRIIKKMKQM